MSLLLSIASAATLAVLAYTRLRAQDPQAASAATHAVRELVAVVLILTKAVEAVVDTLTASQPRAASGAPYRGFGRPYLNAWDEEPL